MIPITFNHDDTRLIGHYVEKDRRMVLRFMPDSNITPDMINGINGQIALTYMITKEKDGIVLEAEILGFSVVSEPKGAL